MQRIKFLPALICLLCSGAFADPVNGWLSWRGPLQTGVSLEKGVPTQFALNSDTHLWTLDLAGRGTPIIAGDRLYTWGYRGEGAELQEVLM